MSISFDLVCFSASDLNACEQTLNACGGLPSLEGSLNTDFSDGLDNDDKEDLESRRKKYGRNEFPEPEISSWFEMFFDTFEDPTLIILLVAAFISLGIGGWEAYTSTATSLFERMQGMIEGTAILVASLLVSAITATQDHDKAMKFQELNAASESINVTVTRGGKVMSVHTSELCVGDLVTLNSGDSVPADGIFIDGSHVNCDESGLTGEPDDIAKTSDPLARFMFSGSRLTSGFCRMVVVAVGENSEWGRIKKGLDVKSEATPLQDKLETLANQIGYVGMAFAAATFVAMMADWYYHSGAVGSPTMFDTALKAFILAVTIVVVAVPEGLPLAVTLSLAYSTSKMMEDNNLIRVLAACETMGNATTICSDKTGTLTQNKMTVVEGWIAGEHAGDAESTSGDNLSWSSSIMNNEDLRYFLSHGISCNSTAALCTAANGDVDVLGNKTEGALLQMLRKSFDIEYDPIRKSNFDTTKGDKLYTFTSERKCMSVLLMSAVGGDNSPRGSSTKKKSAAANGVLNSVSYTKGASEIVLDKCTHYMDKKGQAVPISASVRKTLTSLINEMAKKALRTVAVSHCTYHSLPDLENIDHIESDMVLDGIFGIKDPLRPDVKEAVSICQNSGVMVRMVTGDNIDTAKAIAKECGILTEGGVALEGSEFRTMTPAALDEILPRLQVLARSSPTDKHLLVTRLNGLALPKNREEWEDAHPGESWTKKKDVLLPGYKEEWSAIRPRGGDVVGVTGDGTNDGPALRAADVGLSMGLSGTDVAKAASSIVILDDNFSSIVKAIKWGRSVFDNIRRFLQFQLTVNIVALTVTLLSAMGGRDPPLNAVMMLWVNLIMDALGALALGTEPPSGKLLERLPYKRDSSLVSRVMVRNILFQSCFQVLVLMYLLFLAPGDFGIPADSAVHVTLVFNTFVFCQIFNEMNARSIGSSMDIFKGVFGNPFFCIIIVFTCGMQYAMVEAEYVRWLVHAVPLDAGLWYKSVLIGSLSLPIGGLMRLIPVSENQDDFAEMPALLKTAVSKREKGGGSSAKKGQDESENGLVDSMTFALWLVVCFFVCALAFTEFGAMWMAHIETYLPAPVAVVVVPVLKVLGGALDKVLDATNMTHVF
jgi:magnesium-transporting ATPase (P-type)